jgi:hypothetical protein
MARRHKRRGHGHGLPRGFVSRAQMHLFFARPDLRRKFAHKEAHKAGMYSSITKAVGYSPRYRTLPTHSRSVVSAARRAVR